MGLLLHPVDFVASLWGTCQKVTSSKTGIWCPRGARRSTALPQPLSATSQLGPLSLLPSSRRRHGGNADRLTGPFLEVTDMPHTGVQASPLSAHVLITLLLDCCCSSFLHNGYSCLKYVRRRRPSSRLTHTQKQNLLADTSTDRYKHAH